jgi:hypothetical protein
MDLATPDRQVNVIVRDHAGEMFGDPMQLKEKGIH